MRIIGAAVSHEGHVKAHNEDNVFLFHTYRELEKDRFELKTEADSAHLMASVCDGIGGEANGEIASLLAVDA